MSVKIGAEFEASNDSLKFINSKDVKYGTSDVKTKLDSLGGSAVVVESMDKCTDVGVRYLVSHKDSNGKLDYYDEYYKESANSELTHIGTTTNVPSNILTTDNVDSAEPQNGDTTYNVYAKDGKLKVKVVTPQSSGDVNMSVTNNVATLTSGDTTFDAVNQTYVDGKVTDAQTKLDSATEKANAASTAYSNALAAEKSYYVPSGAVTTDADGNKKIKFTKTTSANTNVEIDITALRGADGTNGIDGTNGTNGTNGVDGKTYVPSGAVTYNSATQKYKLGFTTESGETKDVDVTALKGIQGDKGDDGAYYIPYDSLVMHDSKLSIRFDKSDSAIDKEYVDVSQLKGDNGSNAHVKLIQSTSNGYSHVYVKTWEGDSEPADSSTNKSADLMAQVNDVLEAVEKILDGDLTVDVTE